MLVDFSLRLAAGMMACLLLLSPAATARPTSQRKALANPVFFRTHFLIVLGLSCLALLFAQQTAPRNATEGVPYRWLLAALGAAMLFACLGSVSWSLERSPGGVTLILLSTGCLVAGLVFREYSPQAGETGFAGRLIGDLSAAALLGAATSAMLMGHSYLVSPTMSLTPLYRLLGALAVALVVRMAVDGYVLAAWLHGHSLEDLRGDALLWLPVRWGVGLLAPLVLFWMAWQTARIRSTQSATGILYVVVIFCFLGELTGQLLREGRLTL
jgi:hypothetical protein